MLPIPAITCWSSSSGFSARFAVPNAAAAPAGSNGSAIGSTPERGPARAARRPHVVGVEHDHLAERARVDEPHLADRRRDASPRGCGAARGAPAAASSTWPLMRRWIISVSPESSGSSRYLPRRSAAVDDGVGEPGDQRLAGRAAHRALPADVDRGRSVGRPDGARGHAAPSRPREAPASVVSPSFSLTSDERGQACVAAACSAAFFDRPVALADDVAVDAHGGVERLGVVRALATSPRTPGRRDRRGRSAPAAASCGRTGPMRVGGRRASAASTQPLDHAVRRLGAAVEVHGAEHRLERVGQDRRLVGAHRRRPRPAEQQCRPEVEVDGDLGQRDRVDHALAQVGQLALGRSA